MCCTSNAPCISVSLRRCYVYFRRDGAAMTADVACSAMRSIYDSHFFACRRWFGERTYSTRSDEGTVSHFLNAQTWKNALTGVCLDVPIAAL